MYAFICVCMCACNICLYVCMRLHVLGLIGIGLLACCTPYQLNVACLFVSMYACSMVNGI